MTKHEAPLTRSDVVALRAIAEAAAEVDSARRSPSQSTVSLAEGNLRVIVQSANDQGLSWQSIGDTLGIRRGSAYQRYRRRSSKTPDARVR